jgi:putative FmdB family regulatory protein
MPTYDYECPTCGVFEHYQSIKDAPLKACPTCKSKKVTKLLSTGGGVIFTGSGFWETDYNRSKDYGTKKKAESTAPAKPAAPTTPPAK